jgi:hypothetical protein
MGRLAMCLILLCVASTPAIARQGSGATRSAERPGAIQIAATFGAVTSTWRSVQHNRAVGGVPNSYHLQGRAIDIARRPGVTHRQIDAALRTAGFNLIESLDEGDHSHFAFGPAKGHFDAAPAMAVYPMPPAPTAPALPRLAADDHGTLLVDLPASPARAVGSN